MIVNCIDFHSQQKAVIFSFAGQLIRPESAVPGLLKEALDQA